MRSGDLDLFIAHQANLRIINAAAEKLGLDESKVVKNIHKFGNTTAATIPLAIGDAIDDGRLRKASWWCSLRSARDTPWARCLRDGLTKKR